LQETAFPSHDSLTGPDVLGVVSLNHEWREIVVMALFNYFRIDDSDLSQDNESKLIALV